MAEGQVYDIPEGGLEWLKERVSKLSRKVEKLGGEKLYLTVVGFHFEDSDNPATGRNSKRKMWEVFLAVPEIKLEGWEFMARLDHTDEGTILRKLTTEELPTQYRDASPVCDHCQYKRKRRDTFVVRHCETGEFKQVGSSCLKDFLGHESADKLAKIAEIVSNMGDVLHYARFHRGDRADTRFIDVQAYCEEAAVCILASGWVSKARAKQEGRESTAEKASTAMYWHHGVSAEASDLARNALEWAAGLGGDLSDYEHNIKVIASTECMEERSKGIAASIVGVYWTRQQKSYTFESTFQGMRNESITREVTLHQVQSLQNSTRFQFMDIDGNVYTWFASSDKLRERKGQTFRINGTVKDHVVFRDVRQTLLTRVTALD